MKSVIRLFCPEISHLHGSATVESLTEPGHIPRSSERRDAHGPRTEVVLCCMAGRASGRPNGITNGRHDVGAGKAAPSVISQAVPTPRGFIPVRRGLPATGSDQHSGLDGSGLRMQDRAEAKPRSTEATLRSDVTLRCLPSKCCIFNIHRIICRATHAGCNPCEEDEAGREGDRTVTIGKRTY